jgi:hypothetical protein
VRYLLLPLLDWFVYKSFGIAKLEPDMRRNAGLIRLEAAQQQQQQAPPAVAS